MDFFEFVLDCCICFLPMAVAVFKPNRKLCMLLPSSFNGVFSRSFESEKTFSARI